MRERLPFILDRFGRSPYVEAGAFFNPSRLNTCFLYGKSVYINIVLATPRPSDRHHEWQLLQSGDEHNTMVGLQHASAIALLASTAMGDSLRQVAVVSRHGVRGPYGPDGLPPTLANMQRYSKNAFPFLVSAKDWGTSQNASELVSPKLTAHGRTAIQKMGEVRLTRLFQAMQCNNGGCA